MAFDIAFDYRFAESDFFDDSVRAVLDAAAAVWEDLIGDEFDDVPAGVSFTVRDPGASDSFVDLELDSAIDDLRIFVGTNAPPFGMGGPDSRALARAQVEGENARGDAFAARIGADFRGDGPVTDFQPFAGSLSINPDPYWGVELADAAPRRLDLFSLVLHEIGHVLGLGTAPIFQDRVGPDGFTGPNATAVNGGAPVPMTPNGHHPRAETGTLMAPALAAGERQQPQALDKAMLADIGYAIDGFTAQGRTPAIVTDGDDPRVAGTEVADSLDGGGGADRIQGGAGADHLAGGPGADTLLGQAGADTLVGGAGADSLRGGPGDDTLDGGAGANSLTGGAGADTFVLGHGADGTRITDFDPTADTLRIDPALEADGAAALAERARPAGDGVFTLALDADTTVHLDSTGPLSAGAVELGDSGNPRGGLAAIDDTVRVAPGETVVFDPLANDRASEGSLTAHSVPLRGELEDAPGSSLRFTAPADFTGSAPFSYRLAGESGAADAATVHLTTASPADAAARAPAALTDLNPGAQITALSLAFLGRAPDPGERALWRAELEHARAEGRAPHAALDTVAESFRMSPEAQAQRPELSGNISGAISAGDAVDTLGSVYAAAFGRAPEDAARATWGAELTARLAEGIGVGATVVGILSGAANTAADGGDAPAAVDAGRDSVETAVLGLSPSDEDIA